MNPPIFKSIQQALSFSFGVVVAVPRQKSGTRLALITIIEGIGALTRTQAAFLDYLYGEKGSVNLEGLDAIERHATFAMVVGAVNDHLPTHEVYAIWVRHGWGVYKQTGVIRLARYLHVKLGIPYDAARLLLDSQSLPKAERDADKTFKQIAEKTGVPVRTLERRVNQMRAMLRALENSGYDRLTPMFARDGLIPTPGLE